MAEKKRSHAQLRRELDTAIGERHEASKRLGAAQQEEQRAKWALESTQRQLERALRAYEDAVIGE